MQVGNIWLRLNNFGSSIPLMDVTPAEVAILNEDHGMNANAKDCCFDLSDVREEKRSDEAEINRLREKYCNARDKKGVGLAEKLYPGKTPKLPQTFEEVGLKAGVAAVATPPQPPPVEKPVDHPTQPKPNAMAK